MTSPLGTKCRLVSRGLVAGVASIVLLVAAVVLAVLPNEKPLESIRSLGSVGVVVYVALKASAVILPVSGLPLYVIGPRLYGFGGALALASIGDLLGYVSLFALSRRFGRPLITWTIPRRFVPRLDSAIAIVGTWRRFATARLFFWMAPELPSYAAGMSHLPFSQYLAVSAPLIVLNAIVFLLPGLALRQRDPLLIGLCVTGGLLILWQANRRSGRSERSGKAEG